MARSSTARVSAPTPDQSTTIEALQRQLADAQAALDAERRRNVPPVAPNRRMIDSGDMQVGAGDGDVTMDVSGSPTLIRPPIEIPDGPPTKSFLDELAFNEELVDVKVHEASEQYPEPTVSVWNDGKHQLFIRGQTMTVRRKYLEVLARSKPVTFGNVEYVDAEGNRRVKWPRRTANRWQFTVIRDDNPNGAAWLRKILAQP